MPTGQQRLPRRCLMRHRRRGSPGLAPRASARCRGRRWRRNAPTSGPLCMDMRVGMCADKRMHTHIGLHAYVSSDCTVTVRYSSCELLRSAALDS